MQCGEGKNKNCEASVFAEKNNKNTGKNIPKYYSSYRTVMYEKLKEPTKEIAKGIEDNKNETAIQDPTGYTYAQTVQITKKGSKENK